MIKPDKNNRIVTASELVDKLHKDPSYVAQMDEKRKRYEEEVGRNREAEKPILSDLARTGYAVDSLDQLRRSGKNYQEAVPLMLQWLKKIHNNDVKESIVRTLSVPWARPLALRPFIEQFHLATGESQDGLKWAIGNALEIVADDSVLDDLIEISLDKRHGTARQMVVVALGKMKNRARAIDALMKLLQDEDVIGQAVIALGKLRAKEARPLIEGLLHHEKSWVRKEAKRALKKMK